MRAFSVLIAVIGLTLASTSLPTMAQNGNSGAPLPGRYIVTLHSNANPNEIAGRYGVVQDRQFVRALRGFAAHASEQQAEKLRHDPNVRAVEPDRHVELDPLAAKGSGGGGSTQPTQVVPTGVNRIDAELNSTASIDGVDQRVDVDIAVIDTGVDLSHQDLNVVSNVTFVTGTKNGTDDNGHGTHVAGTCAALDNNIGVVGVAPGARLWAIKVLDRTGSGRLSDIVAGLDYVAQRAGTIDVVNMSLGFTGQSTAFDTAVANVSTLGVTVVVAAGNSTADATTFSPANHPSVIAVSAIADFNGQGGGGAPALCRPDVDDTFADFSNYGPVVDIAAPGVCIRSTWKGNTYNTISGTSMASPHVAGSAALYIAYMQAQTSTRPSPSDVRQALLYNAKLQSNTTFGFTGDPDSSAEPILYSAVLTPAP